MNLGRTLLRRLEMIGLDRDLRVQFSREVSDLLNGRGTLIVLRKKNAGCLRAFTIWFYAERDLKTMVQSDLITDSRHTPPAPPPK